MKTLRIATRKSPLALWQAEYVAGCLNAEGFPTELVPLVSGGDTDMRPIDGTRQIGVFTKRIQQALLEQQADIAVHSLKDLPTEPDERLCLVAVPQRETTDDSLVSPAAWSLEQLPPEARVGTGSRRRGAQLLSARPDLQILPIRGNVQTRLSKLQDGEYHAIVLAEAGVIRLEMHGLARTRLSREIMLPAPGQGALGIEVRSCDTEALQAVSRLDHLPSHAAVAAERQMLAALHGGCLAPIAALCEVQASRLEMTAVVLSIDGKTRIDKQASVPFDQHQWRSASESLARQITEQLVADGAAELIASFRSSLPNMG